MKKIFILLLTLVLVASSFVSCNKTEADPGKTLTLSKISASDEAVFGTATGAVSLAEVEALAEKAVSLCESNDYITAKSGTVAIPDVSKYTTDYVTRLSTYGTKDEFGAAYREYVTYIDLLKETFIALLDERFPDTAQAKWEEPVITNVLLPTNAYIIDTTGLSEEDFERFSGSCVAFMYMDITVISCLSSRYFSVCTNGKPTGEIVFPPPAEQAVLDTFAAAEASLAGVPDVAE